MRRLIRDDEGGAQSIFIFIIKMRVTKNYGGGDGALNEKKSAAIEMSQSSASHTIAEKINKRPVCLIVSFFPFLSYLSIHYRLVSHLLHFVFMDGNSPLTR